MGILDSVLGGLPSLSSVTSKVTSTAISYSIASSTQVVNEAKSAISSTFGSALPFGFIANGTKILSSGSSDAIASATSINEAGGGSDAGSTTYKVKLFGDGDEVSFDSTPDVSESISVDYEALSPPQMPGEFMKYRGTKATTWMITATLTCRTRAEASLKYKDVLVLRGWSKTFFGDKQKTDIFGDKSKLGAPPPVINFSGWRGVVGPVPVVLTSLQISWPKDVDWIQTNFTEKGTSELIPFPTVMQVTINLTESFSADQFNQFDLAMFKNGDMIGAYGMSGTVSSTGEASGEFNSLSGSVGNNLGITKETVNEVSESSEFDGAITVRLPGTEENDRTLYEVDDGNASEVRTENSIPDIPATSEISKEKVSDKAAFLSENLTAIKTMQKARDQAQEQLTFETNPETVKMLNARVEALTENVRSLSTMQSDIRAYVPGS